MTCWRIVTVGGEYLGSPFIARDRETAIVKALRLYGERVYAVVPYEKEG